MIRAPMPRSGTLGRDPAKPLRRRAGIKPVSDRKAAAGQERGSRPQRKDTIPPKARRAVRERDQRWCLHCGGYFPDGGIHLHHRRLKQAGGDPRPHTDCACNLVSLCWGCHAWFHDTEEGRAKAEAEGFIIPNATLEPGLLPVAVHGELDSGGVTAWPACEGGRDGWVFTRPLGGAA